MGCVFFILMRCPYCKADQDRVIDSRASADGFAIRRRRECLQCERRYTTYERAESAPIRVVKKGGDRAAFDRQNIRSGLLRACEKRPVSSEQLDAVVERVERKCLEAFDKEIPTRIIGNLIMEELKQLDQVAYVRFASVYRDFQDVTEFMQALTPMLRQAQDSCRDKHEDGLQQNRSRGEGAADAENSEVSSQET